MTPGNVVTRLWKAIRMPALSHRSSGAGLRHEEEKRGDVAMHDASHRDSKSYR